MSEPRFYLSPDLCDKVAIGSIVFCDQVGKSDIYLSENLVIEINRHWAEGISTNDFGRWYAYRHAKLKYARIANKIAMMRGMLWSKPDEG